MKKLLQNYIKWGWCFIPAIGGNDFKQCLNYWNRSEADIDPMFIFGLILHALAFGLLVLAWHNPIPSTIIGLIIWKTISHWKYITSSFSKFINWLTEDED